MAKKKLGIKILKKGQRCPKDWSSVEIKVDRRVRRACIRGKISNKPSTLSVMADGAILALEAGLNALS